MTGARLRASEAVLQQIVRAGAVFQNVANAVEGKPQGGAWILDP